MEEALPFRGPPSVTRAMAACGIHLVLFLCVEEQPAQVLGLWYNVAIVLRVSAV